MCACSEAHACSFISDCTACLLSTLRTLRVKVARASCRDTSCFNVTGLQDIAGFIVDKDHHIRTWTPCSTVTAASASGGTASWPAKKSSMAASATGDVIGSPVMASSRLACAATSSVYESCHMRQAVGC